MTFTAASEFQSLTSPISTAQPLILLSAKGWPLIVLHVVADPTSLANSQGRSKHIFFSSFSTRSTFSIHLHPGRFRHAMQQHAYSLCYVGRETCSKTQVKALQPELELTVTKSSRKSLMSCMQGLQAPPVLRAGSVQIQAGVIFHREEVLCLSSACASLCGTAISSCEATLREAEGGD